MNPARRKVGRLLFLLWAQLVIAPAFGQGFPSRPITLIQTSGVGSVTDVIVRLIGKKLGDLNGWKVVVDNRPGGNQIIGTQAVLQAPSDGYTILGIGSTLAILPTSNAGRLPFDPVKDLTPLIRYTNFQGVLAANPTVPVRNLNELIAYSKANPGKLNYGINGAGSWFHLIGELVRRETGLDMAAVPYKEGTQVQMDVVGGTIQLIMASAPSVVPHVKEGKLRPIAVLSAKRFVDLPNLSTIGEQLPAFLNLDLDAWGGLMLRAGTPRQVVSTLHGEMSKVLRLPETQQQIVHLGGAPVVDETPEAFAKKYESDISRWEKVVRETNLKFD